MTIPIRREGRTVVAWSEKHNRMLYMDARGHHTCDIDAWNAAGYHFLPAGSLPFNNDVAPRVPNVGDKAGGRVVLSVDDRNVHAALCGEVVTCSLEAWAFYVSLDKADAPPAPPRVGDGYMAEGIDRRVVALSPCGEWVLYGAVGAHFRVTANEWTRARGATTSPRNQHIVDLGTAPQRGDVLVVTPKGNPHEVTYVKGGTVHTVRGFTYPLAVWAFYRGLPGATYTAAPVAPERPRIGDTATDRDGVVRTVALVYGDLLQTTTGWEWSIDAWHALCTDPGVTVTHKDLPPAPVEGTLYVLRSLNKCERVFRVTRVTRWEVRVQDAITGVYTYLSTETWYTCCVKCLFYTKDPAQ